MINEILRLSKEYQVNAEDILFIHMSRYGVNVEFPYSRVRFVFSPYENAVFSKAHRMNIDQFFLALPRNPESPFSVHGDKLYLDDVVLGEVSDLKNDTCDTHYTRRNGTVINLNPVSKSKCHGCKFCHTIVQNANDTDMDISSCENLEKFFNDFMTDHKIADLSSIVQVAVVTGGFGEEGKVLNYLEMLSRTLENYNFKGEILYFGAEIHESGLERLGKIKHKVVYCYTVECFTHRSEILKKEKAQISVSDVMKLFDKAISLGIDTTFSYVLGIDSLDSISEPFANSIGHITRFPIINVYQQHGGASDDVLAPEAKSIEYYLNARLKIEDLFKNTKLLPRPWENYRSLWYLTFGNIDLMESRIP